MIATLSLFHIPKMDCAAEEQMVRDALEGMAGELDFLDQRRNRERRRDPRRVPGRMDRIAATGSDSRLRDRSRCGLWGAADSAPALENDESEAT